MAVANLAISPEEIRTTAAMARLHLDERDGELDRLAAELSRILDFAARLGEVDTSGIEPTTHAVPLDCPLRVDAIEPHLLLEQVEKSAPAMTDQFFTVPAILGGGSDDES